MLEKLVSLKLRELNFEEFKLDPNVQYLIEINGEMYSLKKIENENKNKSYENAGEINHKLCPD